MNINIDKDSNWHLDKRVPIALIFALAIQSAGAIWWASSISERVTNNTITIEQLERKAEVARATATAQAVQLGRIEEQIIGLRSDLERFLTALGERR